MVPRGEVGIVVAGLGLTTGAIDGQIYSVVVGMAVLTTLIVPPLLPRLMASSDPPEETAGVVDDRVIEADPSPS
jgi:Kef-type K+ transport system membrane component KefB